MPAPQVHRRARSCDETGLRRHALRGPRRVIAICVVAGGIAVMPSTSANAGDIDTEHIFGFMIGSDVGQVGEREFQSATTGRFGKAAGRYRAGEQEFELEVVPADNIRIEVGSTISAFGIAGVPGLADQRSLGWQGASFDFRYHVLDRDSTGLGMTLSLQAGIDRIDEISALPVRSFGTGVVLAFDRELASGTTVAALNLIYQPAWTRDFATEILAREANVGAAVGMMTQVHPGVLLGAEARYMRTYEGLAPTGPVGQALFAGPTLYVQLSDRSRLTASWSAQLWGRSADAGPLTLDLVDFERHQARIVYGVNF